MLIRKATIIDVSSMMELVSDAQAFLKMQGVDQWQNGYPTIDIIQRDIANNNSYVLTENNQIVAMFTVIYNNEPTYDMIYDGKWLSVGDFVVVHRLAVRKEYKKKGLASFLLNEVEKMALEKKIPSFKIDTHKDNIPMRQVLEKNGFSYCGVIKLMDGNLRVAYEKILPN